MQNKEGIWQKCFRDLSYICIILFIVLGWHIMDNIVSEKEVDITSLEVALRSAGDNRGELEKSPLLL